MITHSSPESHFLDLGRLVALIDGVFAVALTLLILDLKLPRPSGDLVLALQQMFPSLLIYLLVFASIAGYWIIHHTTFRQVRQTDGRLVLLSLLNLLFVTLFPVAASIVGAYPLAPIATVCLSANSLLYCLSAWAVWSYTESTPRLLFEDANRHRLQQVARIMLLVAICLLLAIPFAFLNVYLAYALWILSAPLAGWCIRGRKKFG